MTQDASPVLEELVALAKDYDKKRRRLDALALELSPDLLRRHLLALSERATDRFRAAQQSLFQGLLEDPASPAASPLEAARTVCRCFDEMVLLFHKLADLADPSS